MLGSTPITIAGNLTADPELRFTPTGVPAASFTVAATERKYNQQSGKYEDAGTLFLRVTCWRELAENVAESMTRGMRVVVTGTLHQRGWETKDGEKRTSYEVQAEEVAASMRWASVKVSRNQRSAGPVPEDPWANASPARPASPPADGAPVEDEPPF